jgi:hypothetical protein
VLRRRSPRRQGKGARCLCTDLRSTVCDPPKLGLVRREHHWCVGELRGWPCDLDGWAGYVRYAVSPGLRHLEWGAGDRLREAQ